MIPADEELTPIASALVARIAADVNAGADLESLVAAPQVIGSYKVGRLLGTGGYGYVHLAFDIRRNDHQVALKIPRREVLASPDLKSRFLREARKIGHPNVVRVLDSGEEGDDCYIAMELCPEGSLGKWLQNRDRREALPPRWVAALVAEIADGVHAAHLLGLLHRDLKPANVMLVKIGECEDAGTPSFRPKVGDFGLVKVLEEGTLRMSATTPGTRVGTLAYTSPEQARGDEKIRLSSDVYSLGVILFELLTGEHPYPSKSEAELLSRILNPAPARSARLARGGLPQPLVRICQASLAKSPSDRYASADELAEELRRYLRNKPVHGMPLWKRALGTVRQHRNRIAVGLLVVALIIICVGALGYQTVIRTGSWFLEVTSSGDLSTLPPLLAGSPWMNPILQYKLEQSFRYGSPIEKLKAAIVLADLNSECADYAYDELITGRPEESGLIAQMLSAKIPRLADRLRVEVETSIGREAVELSDQRRANAATALMMIGVVDAPDRLMRPEPNPQARSFFIDGAGRAGVSPELIYAQILDRTPEVETRPAWIQALGEVPDAQWNEPLKTKVTETLWQLYRDDPNAAVHSSAKWLLKNWGKSAELKQVDRELKERGQCEGFQWRVTPDLLTFLCWTDANTNRVLEVTDTEITCEVFLSFLPDHEVNRSFCREDDSAIVSVTYVDAAKFCGLLDDHEGTPPDQRCYHRGTSGRLEPVPGSSDLHGFRLLTDREFVRMSRSQTTTKRYYGDTVKLMPKYVWYRNASGQYTRPVGLLKPNDLGFFDTLGNASEVCQTTVPDAHSTMQACFCGGSFFNVENNIDILSYNRPTSTKDKLTSWDVGFRVARTVKPRDGD